MAPRRRRRPRGRRAGRGGRNTLNVDCWGTFNSDSKNILGSDLGIPTARPVRVRSAHFSFSFAGEMAVEPPIVQIWVHGPNGEIVARSAPRVCGRGTTTISVGSPSSTDYGQVGTGDPLVVFYVPNWSQQGGTITFTGYVRLQWSNHGQLAKVA